MKTATALLIASAACAFAQSPFPPTAPASVGAAIDREITLAERQVVGAVEAMPADKFNYKPTPAQNTFGHLVVHMAETNDLLCSGAAGVPAPKVEQVGENEPKDKLVAALKASFDFCADTLAKMDDSKLGETSVVPNGQQLSRARFALGIASNWADHYGEAAMYLRLNDILPPTAKK